MSSVLQNGVDGHLGQEYAKIEDVAGRRRFASSKARRPRIGLVLGHPRRDLVGLVLVALELVQAGAEAVVIPHHTARPDGTLSDLDAILVNHARPATIPVIRWLASRGKAVFVLDDEGYLSSHGHQELVQAIAALGIGPWLQGYFVWGEASGKALAKADPALASRIRVTGCPRFDLLAPQWRKMLHFDSTGYVLLNPNFNGVNPLDNEPDKARAEMVRNGWEPSYLDRFLADMRAAFSGFLELCETLPRRLPQLQFILRPHPFEAVAPYARAVSGLSNVRLDTKGDVSRVLANASHLVHVNCNTSVEARLLGLRSIQASFLTTKFLREHLPVYSGVSIAAHDVDDLCRLLSDDTLLNARDDVQGIFERWIRPSFHECDGHAARRIAGTMMATLHEGGSLPPAGDRGFATTLGPKAKLAVSALLGTEAIQAARRWIHPHRRAKVFSVGQVQDLVQSLSAHAGLAPPPVQRLSSPLTAMPMSAIQIG
jgi:surface carbohydrate biosynthesis protein